MSATREYGLLDIASLHILFPFSLPKHAKKPILSPSSNPNKHHKKRGRHEDEEYHSNNNNNNNNNSNNNNNNSTFTFSPQIIKDNTTSKRARVESREISDLLSLSPMEALSNYQLNKKRRMSNSQLVRNQHAWRMIGIKKIQDEREANMIDINIIEEPISTIALREADEKMATDFGLTQSEINALDEIADGDFVNEEQYRDVFSKYDVDGSGTISPDELNLLVTELGENLAKHEIEKLIKDADIDGDGQIDFIEFVELMKARKRLLAIATKLTNHSENNRIKSEFKSPFGSTTTKVPGAHLPIFSLGTSSPAPILPSLRLEGTTGIEKRPINIKKRKRKADDGIIDLDSVFLLHNQEEYKSNEDEVQDLRRMLVISEKNEHHFSELVEKDIRVIQSNYPITGLKAQIFCKKWGFDKLEKIFKKIEYSQVISSFLHWIQVTKNHKAQEKAEQYLRFRGSRRLVSMMADWQRKKFLMVWNTWTNTIQRQKQDEIDAAAVQIQRFVLGWLRATVYQRERRLRAVNNIQRVGRGYMARKKYKVMKRNKLEYDSAVTIQQSWRNYISKRIVRALKRARKEKYAATKIQKVFRGLLGRRKAKRKKIEKLQFESSSCIQRSWRCHKARKVVSARRSARFLKNSAITIQCSWRCFKSRKELRKRKKLYKAARCIQRHIRGWIARIKCSRMWVSLADAEKLRIQVKASQDIQKWWRYRKERKVAKKMILLENQMKEADKIIRKAASIKIQKVIRGFMGRRKVIRIRLRNSSIVEIQRVGRGYIGRKKVKLIKRQKNAQANKDKSATKIQKVYRGRVGRKKAKKKLKESQEMKAEREKAAILIQSLGRGYISRKSVSKMVKDKNNLIEKQNNAATIIQKIVRGRLARKRVKLLKATKKLEKIRNIAATKIQCQIRKYLAKKYVKELRRRKGLKKSERIALEKKDEEEKKRKVSLENEKNKAATKLQALSRGRMERKKVQNMKEKEDAKDVVTNDAIMKSPKAKTISSNSSTSSKNGKATEVPSSPKSKSSGKIKEQSKESVEVPLSPKSIKEKLKTDENKDSSEGPISPKSRKKKKKKAKTNADDSNQDEGGDNEEDDHEEEEFKVEKEEKNDVESEAERKKKKKKKKKVNADGSNQEEIEDKAENNHEEEESNLENKKKKKKKKKGTTEEISKEEDVENEDNNDIEVKEGEEKEEISTETKKKQKMRKKKKVSSGETNTNIEEGGEHEEESEDDSKHNKLEKKDADVELRNESKIDSSRVSSSSSIVNTLTKVETNDMKEEEKKEKEIKEVKNPSIVVEEAEIKITNVNIPISFPKSKSLKDVNSDENKEREKNYKGLYSSISKEDAAATKVQALTRGRKARKGLKKKNKDENDLLDQLSTANEALSALSELDRTLDKVSDLENRTENIVKKVEEEITKNKNEEKEDDEEGEEEDEEEEEKNEKGVKQKKIKKKVKKGSKLKKKRKEEIKAKEKAEKEALSKKKEEEDVKITREKALNDLKNKSAIEIQKIGRGYLARRNYRVVKHQNEVIKGERKANAIITIQCAIRVFFAKKELRRRKKRKRAAEQEKEDKMLEKKQYNLLKEQQKQEIAATKIQSIGRGKAGREIAMKRRKEGEKGKKREIAATIIQSRYRGHVERKKFKLLKQERQKNLLQTVTTDDWVQYWDDSNQCYYYFNSKTQEASWTLPGHENDGYDTGYATSGSVADYHSDGYYGAYPSDGYGTAGSYYNNYKVCNTCNYDYATKTCKQCHSDFCDSCCTKVHQEQSKKFHVWAPVVQEEEVVAPTAFCIDCEVTAASKKCDQCEDSFCDNCYDNAHKKGKKNLHTWKPIGDFAASLCVECEKNPAVRECHQCGDKYCVSCFDTLHRKGKKASHTYGEVSNKAGAAASLWNDVSETDSVTSSVDGDWVEYFDAASQRPYYYNVTTGMTSW